jgi:hypothetical protein
MTHVFRQEFAKKTYYITGSNRLKEEGNVCFRFYLYNL